MFRDTMISTMPVAMMAIEVLCTDRFHRLREVRKSPPDKMLNAIQMTIIAVIIPNSRVSTSARLARHDDAGGGAGVASDAPSAAAAGGVTEGARPADARVITHVSSPSSFDLCCTPNVPPARESRTRGTFFVHCSVVLFGVTPPRFRGRPPPSQRRRPCTGRRC